MPRRSKNALSRLVELNLPPRLHEPIETLVMTESRILVRRKRLPQEHQGTGSLEGCGSPLMSVMHEMRIYADKSSAAFGRAL